MIRAAAAVALAGLVVTGSAGSAERTRCPSGTGFAQLAYVKEGALLVLEMPACGGRVLVRRGAGPPVRWSGDGRYVLFSGGVVEVDTGRVYPNLRGVWAPRGHLLATVTPGGGLVLAAPGAPRRRLLPDGFDAGTAAFDPTGRRVAVDRPARGELWVVDVRSRSPRLVHRAAAPGARVPELAGWATRESLLFRLRVPNANSANLDGLPLYAVSTGRGPSRRIAASVPSHQEYVTSCGSGLLVSAGGDRSSARGKRGRQGTHRNYRIRTGR